MDVIHHIEVVELMQHKVSAATDCLWLKQLRFYADHRQNVAQMRGRAQCRRVRRHRIGRTLRQRSHVIR